MRNLKPVFIMVAALLMAVALAHPSLADQGPRIQLGEKTFDFGPVKEGQVLEHDFKVFNRGDQPLLIEKVSPS
jgi:hypothetical protein